ncbi:AAA-like domain-containing protein [Nodosilinea sp. LEGE 07298]|uniref:AAA-like domain-containing protein n=1 Tax=Nodosilinea sp. LEGE 07298 TaxID=2777970 RepID=UPI001880AF63|nr:AAA-like domain-containing protein [Nodosilinea sp. LEGE 07298]MBE9110692.1 AAA-like domain-containing protein [Nodosilinea sp. LEGE 07298]
MTQAMNSGDRRKRGVVLSAQGWQRLRAAEQQLSAQQNNGNPYTLDQLCAVTGLSANTLVKARRRQKPVDLTTLDTYFGAFDLGLTADDYLLPEDTQRLETSLTVQRGPLNGPLPLDSPFYLYRPGVEASATQEILTAGALVRLKAPRQFGKTSLLNLMLGHAQDYGLRLAVVSLQAIDRGCLGDLNQTLRWFCAVVARSLGLPNQLDQRWDGLFGGSYSCTDYFETYLLPASDQPLLLVIDDLDELFAYGEVATDFLGMLRAWYEQGRYGTDQNLWPQLRLVIAHSTEAWLPLSLHQSPFNVGFSIELPPFSLDQVQELALRYGLAPDDNDLLRLLDLVGGHPYLTQLSLFHLTQQQTLDTILEQAVAYDGIYSSHLRRQVEVLEAETDLSAAMVQVATSSEGVRLPPQLSFRLQGLGLVRFRQQLAVASCELYRQYFATLPEN